MTHPSAEVGSALSLDGRSFSYETSVGSRLIAGDLVVLTTPDGRRLCGQLQDKRASDTSTATGTGVILGSVEDGRLARGSVEPFGKAMVEAADESLWDSVAAGSGATMQVGTARSGPACLRPGSINRHTFLCGQSGSGKSYTLGVLLEQVILDTDLPLVVLDPNADFVGLGTPRDDAPAAVVDHWAASRFEVLRPSEHLGAHNRLCVRFTALTTAAKAAVLQLDPLADRHEFNALVRTGEALRTEQTGDVVDRLLHSEEPADIALSQRMENLGLLEWSVWARDDVALTERLADRARVTVLDLSGFELPQERLVVALDLLDHLWADRGARRPTLLVVDEAHNVCSANPTTPLERATTERLVQIAGEGRKYGLWMLLCTQRPSRISPAVISQCDNLVLMRMNSRGDLAELQETFGFVPAQMLAAAPFFRQGEALVAGGFVPVPTFVQIGGRRTHEGGSDVKVPLPRTDAPVKQR